MTAIIGIDPGKNGGVAVLDETGVLRLFKFDGKTEQEITDFLFDISFCYAKSKAYLEQVGARPGQGVTSMFTFGKHYGFIRGVLTSFRIPFWDVSPQRWQAGLKITKSPSKSEHKKKLLQIAQQHFPRGGVTRDTADAVLIAEWALGLKQSL